ncbi:MAG TPA: hypothetical protein VG758_04860 [Hyphomicrobiaceae bacterium]|jgi:hypothetical protein|nr:hypothetical protein [Hyphomicrobiaceae bacterium]
MASRIRKPVQRVMGWTFVIVVIAALGLALLTATQPRVEVTGPIKVRQQMH